MEPISLQKMREEVRSGKHRPRFNALAMARKAQTFMECLQADPYHLLGGADVSSLEPTISAEFSKDKYYCYATRDGVGLRPYIDDAGVLMIDDIYLMFGSTVPKLGDQVKEAFVKENLFDTYMEDSELVTKKHPVIKSLRQKIFKPSALGLERGMGWHKLRNDLIEKAGVELTRAEAKDIITAYWNLFKDLRLLGDRLALEIEKQGFYTTPFGMPIYCESHKGLAYFTQAVGMGVLDLIQAKYYTRVGFDKYVATIHDEMIFQIPESFKEENDRIFQECLESLNHDLNWSAPIRMAPQYGRNFWEIK
jgi:hypothetical protein